MRIVIDMQGAQGGSLYRGIGRYTLSLVQAIVRNHRDHEIILVLNGLFLDTMPTIYAAFENLLPKSSIHIWQAPGPVNFIDEINTWRRQSAELLREAFLAKLEPDIILVTSLFEGLSEQAVTSIGLFADIPTAVVLYDLIPLIQRTPYLENPIVEHWYETKLGSLRRANLLLGISESSRQEGIDYLGFSDRDCINISTAADAHFAPKFIATEQKEDIGRRYNLTRPFLMYTGGIDHRKNIEGLIEAFSLLPESLRSTHQLAIVCAVQPQSRMLLETLVKKLGLGSDDVILTGFVSDEDLLSLYNLCKAFIFPSWHEGFGLPALEAMACGRAVIAANTSSLPEVIGCAEALFNPHDHVAMSEMISKVLLDPEYRTRLEKHGVRQAKKFSWDITASHAIDAFELLHEKQRAKHCDAQRVVEGRPKLAFISPLPPERSGISDYSAELLRELVRYYDVDVVSPQLFLTDPGVKANCGQRSVEWFVRHAKRYDRVLYHFGNSEFHQHMFALLEEIPGFVVLHDFYLSGVIAHMDFSGLQPGLWARVLYEAHGYAAVQERFHAPNPAAVIWKYPCNMEVLQNALGIIVHSHHSSTLGEAWYGKGAADDWHVIPLLRIAATKIDKEQARRKLGIAVDEYIVCSFGMLSRTKLNHRLIDAFIESRLARDPKCVLVFVGENDPSEYGASLIETIRKHKLEKRIRITGWADIETFKNYLAAANLAVQLRTLSRGETSAAVLDCMNYGLPTIVNNNGSMSDIDDECVWKIADEFDQATLVQALEKFVSDPVAAKKLGTRGREEIISRHSPSSCALQYVRALETGYKAEGTKVSALINKIADLDSAPEENSEWVALASKLAYSFPERLAFSQLLLDISGLVTADAKELPEDPTSNLQRSNLRQIFDSKFHRLKIEPVYCDMKGQYKYARSFTANLLQCPKDQFQDSALQYRSGDCFVDFNLDMKWIARQSEFYKTLRMAEVDVKFWISDLSQLESIGIAAGEKDEMWAALMENNGILCGSEKLAASLQTWFSTNIGQTLPKFSIDWFK